MIEFDVPDHDAPALARLLSQVIDPLLGWYCDFRQRRKHSWSSAEKVPVPATLRHVQSSRHTHAESVSVPTAQLDWPESVRRRTELPTADRPPDAGSVVVRPPRRPIRSRKLRSVDSSDPSDTPSPGGSISDGEVIWPTTSDPSSASPVGLECDTFSFALTDQHLVMKIFSDGDRRAKTS